MEKVKTGVKKDLFSHIGNYDYSTYCKSTNNTVFPSEYEIDRNTTGTLRNQKFENCVANVIAQIAEANWGKMLDYEEHSEGFAYGSLRHESSNSPGMIVSNAMEYWRTIGTVPKKYFDIDAEMPEMKEIVHKYPDLYELAHEYKIEGYFTIRGTGRLSEATQVKDAITAFKTGLVGVSHHGFTGGSHCILITGWNDKNNTYKFKNSWGSTYGDNGFSEIDRTDVDELYVPVFKQIELPFTDVNKDDWFYNDVKNAYFTGFMKGTGIDTFEPNKPLTRAEMSAVTNRLMKEIDKRFDLLKRTDEDKKEYTER